MEKAKVVLAIIPEEIRQSLKSLVQHETDIEIIKEVLDPVELLMAIGETEADVAVICGPDFNEEPGICSHLLAEYPRLLIFALSPEGHKGYMYRQSIIMETLSNVSGKEILAAIRSA